MMLWNRINVENLKLILQDNNPVFLEICRQCKISIVVMEYTNTKLVIIGNSDYDINIKMGEFSNLVVNSINKNNSVNVNINLFKKSSIIYNHSVLANMNSENSFNVYHINNDSISNLVNNGINISDNKLFFSINGKIPKDLKNIVCNQKSKIINYDTGNSKIIPNLIIDSNDIIANHSAYIGEINEEESFYMQTRGISDFDIKKAIYRATMLGTMELSDEESEFNKRINEWW